MSTKVPHPVHLERALIKRGLLPPESRLLEISMAVMQPTVVRYEVFLSTEQMLMFADALHEAAREAA